MSPSTKVSRRPIAMFINIDLPFQVGLRKVYGKHSGLRLLCGYRHIHVGLEGLGIGREPPVQGTGHAPLPSAQVASLARQTLP
ncbi:hypothetical protein [Roseateles sp.]|uniref:hypothetical protein n=1 Tax=Roseateles sp. TaxID=1971397 RepID=UPI0037CC7897